ncbi:DUF3080 family protein [Marinimicrobium alkaliphilum]|uniref:DUF3080 family protein n=1 Tax=Marinimicrobium alkaliphilum TaxID=2202654 RepID=UPI000DB98C78|nr:DUF3080 family protein [Marinimicrobium alkaliphilum]
MTRLSIRLLLVLLALCLGACSPQSAEDVHRDYLARLARVLDAERPRVERDNPPRLPRSAELRQVIESPSVNLLDWWAFRECGLTPLLSERNTSLARVMPPAHHMDMDARIIQQLRHCNDTVDDEELLALSESLFELKMAQWPARYWNATAAGPELRLFWSPSTNPLRPGDEASYSPAIAAIERLTQLHDQVLSPEDWPGIRTLEPHYQALERGRLGGQLVQSLQVNVDYLQAANRMMAEAVERRALCPVSPQADLTAARNVMTLYFIGSVQPMMAAVNQRANLLLPAYARLIAVQDPTLQPLIAGHRDAVQGLHETALQATRQHVDYWQQLFAQCGREAVER